MKRVLLCGAAMLVATTVAAQTPPPDADRAAQAYEQFLLGRHLETTDKVDQAVAAYRRAMQLDPSSAEIPAELSALYLRQDRGNDALTAAEQALKLDPKNREAHRVAGFVYAALADPDRRGMRGGEGTTAEGNLAKAIAHFEAYVDESVGEPDPNIRATLARLYLRSGAADKAIPILSDLVAQEPGWQDGPLLLAESYASAADTDEREHRWKDAAEAYGHAMELAPRSPELKARYASALLNAGTRDEALKARDILTDAVKTNPSDSRALYLLAQAQRRLGDPALAEQTARRVITQNPKSPWGYYALSEALEERHQYQAVIDALTPAINEARAGAGDKVALGLLLPHVGFAYQELGQTDKALAVFQEAHKVSPDDPSTASYLIQAYIAAKKFGPAIQLADEARASRPNDLRLARLEAQALRQNGKAEQAIALLQTVLKANGNDPSAYVALAQIQSESDRGDDAVRTLRDAEAKFPRDDSIPFELGAVYDKQKRFSDAEAAFKQVIARDPDNAQALNYLGYMLAERGERLDESVDLIKRALALEPDNGSYLDSLGWAYYKADKLDLAEENLKRAADQMTNNSVIQDHYGDVLFKRGRVDEAIAAWTRALNGDRDSIDTGTINNKIKSARKNLGRR